MRVTKAHGTGNDFVVLEDLEDRIDLSSDLVVALCDRRKGVGADGVLRLVGDGDADVFMDYRNADGSIGEMCGNGVRVVAKHVLDRGLVVAEDGRVRVGTRAGLRTVVASRDADGRVAEVTVDMGPASRRPGALPFNAEDEGAERHRVVVEGQPIEVSVASMGNPHAVLVVDDISRAPVTELGPGLEHNERFPQRVNVGFAEVIDEAAIRLRVWERGVGETQACGTGACASVAVLQDQGRIGDKVAVHLPGGVLRIERVDGTLELTGPAVEVGDIELDPAWLSEAAGAAR